MSMIEINSGKRAVVKSATPTTLLNSIIEKRPRATRLEHTEDFRERMKMPRNEELLDEIIDFFVSFHYNKLTRVASTPRQRAAKAASRKAAIVSGVSQGMTHFMKVGYLDFPMPNGKLFRDCTISEARKMAPKIGGLMTVIAHLKGKASDVIGKVYSEAQLKKLAA